MNSVPVRTGLDALASEGYRRLWGKRVGVVCNQTSISVSLRHLLELLSEASRGASDGKRFEVTALFGPQHGLWGQTQDNMIEWEGGVRDSRHGWMVHSLYGEHRKPTRAMLDGLDLLVIDLQDVGARCYTFASTMALCLEACAEAGLPVLVLDRPNPCGGVHVEGPMLDPGFASYVGLCPVALRHGLTLGELAMLLQQTRLPRLDLTVTAMEGWSRAMTFAQTGLPWVPPSPNIPTLDTVTVYPGMCLLEGTNISEGRGTTRPFESFGAPWLDGAACCTRLNALSVPGAWFRPIVFEPTFDKFAGQLCEGAFVHVTDASVFEPVVCGYAALSILRTGWPDQFAWRQPPFEYETEKLPIDILAGTDRLRRLVEAEAPLAEAVAWLHEEAAHFATMRNPLIYNG